VVKNTMIACGVAVALVAPGVPALAAGGGQSGTHRVTPVAAAYGHKGGARGAHRTGQGRGVMHGKNLRQFEGVIVTVAPESLALRVQGSPGVTVTVGLSATGTRVTADDSVTTTAALASGEQVHVVASSATTNGAMTYTAVRITIQRRDADTTADTDARDGARESGTTHDTAPPSSLSSEL